MVPNWFQQPLEALHSEGSQKIKPAAHISSFANLRKRMDFLSGVLHMQFEALTVTQSRYKI